MAFFTAWPLALAVFSSPSTDLVSPPSPDLERELVVALAPAGPVGRAATAADLLARHGLVARRVLDAGLPPAAPRAAAPAAWALDPARVLRVAAADAAGARAALVALAAAPEVAWAEPLARREAADFPDDPLYVDSRQWGLRNLGPAGVYGGVAGADVGATRAWRVSVGHPELWLAIADTGVDLAHPDLQATLADGTPRLVAVDVAEDGAGSPWDSLGHGTAVAGVAAARSGEGAHRDSLGAAGLCGGDGRADPGCRLLALKVTRGRAGTATSFDLARAILHAARAGARAVNVSFAGGGASRLERLAMLEALRGGCLVVAAAGNRGVADGAAAQYPAAYAADGVGLQVGASDPFDRRAAFSSHGPGLDLLAPGVDVWAPWPTYPNANGVPGSGWLAVSGTSFAAPFATGAAGLLAAHRPRLAADDLRVLLRDSARDLGASGDDSFTGRGGLDAGAALARIPETHALHHGEAAASRLVPAGRGTLILTEPSGPLSGPWPAERFEASVEVALPDSFADDARVWPRLGGTTTIRGDFRAPYATPWAETLAVPRRVALRGFVFRLTPADGTAPFWFPVPPADARIAFTILGRRAPATPPPALAATPNPFRSAVRLTAARAGRVTVFDVAGRRVRSGPVAAGAPFLWDGRDERGRAAPPGLYLARWSDGREQRTTRLVRLR